MSPATTPPTIPAPGRQAAAPPPRTRRLLLWLAPTLKLSAVALWSLGLPLAPALALFLTPGCVLLYHLLAPSAGGLVHVRTRFTPSSPGAREVWLTIDDGPDPQDTPRILDLLEEHEARATFFLIGERAARHPELVAEIVRRGHEIGHHTHRHPTLSFWCAGRTRVRRELDDALAALATVAPDTPIRRFRPPVGIKNFFLGPALAERGLECVGWTIRSGDTLATDPEAVGARVFRRLEPGAIVLLHEGPPLRRTVRAHAIRSLLRDLRGAGYRAVVPPV
jgi:peptidoglycan/xylan/chitin deacetylase (PgdA/CDA1 family)